MNRNQWLSDQVKPQLGTVKVAIEVGVWMGEYSHFIVSHLSPEKFYGIDPYMVYDENPDAWTYNDQVKLDAVYKKISALYDTWPGAKLLRSTSEAVAETLPDQSVDFIYIDGDHSYEFVSNDIARWWPKIRDGGILSGHDYISGNAARGHVYGVIPAVNEFVKKYGLTLKLTDDEYATWWVVK